MKPSSIAIHRHRKEVLSGWALLLPALIIMLVFTVYPVFRSLYLSLTKYKMGMTAPEFIGFDNFVRLWKSSTFWKVMGNTVYFALLTVIPSMVLGLCLAMLVNRTGKHIGFIRSAFFYPSIMPMIAIAATWLFIYMARNGLFDQLLQSMGFEPMDVLSHKETVLPAMAVMYVWRESGYLMVFFLSGLQAINQDVLEAASIDGATGWKTFRYITLPLLAPTTLFISTIAFTNCFKLADQVIIMTEGAPNNASTLLLYYIYQQGFTNMNYGVSSALTVIMLALLMLVSMPRFFSQDRKIHYT
ncbi:MAG: sugar ABC transporter permease [Clostridiales bacterium]|nr:sugar ABC transporter permease [Clostridiales bacterium]